MTNVTESGSRKRKRLGKNKKKSWKHTDIIDVEEYLEDKRLQERTGGLVAEKTDADLFFVDKDTNDKDTEQPARKRKRQEKKRLKCHALLEPDPRVPPVTVNNNTRRNQKKLCRAKREKLKTGILSRTQKVAARQRQLAADTRQQNRKKKPTVATFDLWGKTDINALPSNQDEHYLEITKRKRVQPHPKLKEKPSALPAVEVAHPGASYNPAFNDHQELLQAALDRELKREKEEKRLRRALDEQFPTASEAPSQASYLQEMSAGIFEEEGEEGEAMEREEGDKDGGTMDRLSVNAPVRREDKKTVTQRNKERRQKLQVKTSKVAKQQRVHAQQKFRIKTMKVEIRQREALLQQRATQKAQLKELHKDDPKKLGKLKFEAPNQEIKLSDELQGSLRLLKPEGDLAADRFHSLQKRNLIETRKRTKVSKKYKRKKYEKRSHKGIDA